LQVYKGRCKAFDEVVAVKRLDLDCNWDLVCCAASFISWSWHVGAALCQYSSVLLDVCWALCFGKSAHGAPLHHDHVLSAWLCLAMACHAMWAHHMIFWAPSMHHHMLTPPAVCCCPTNKHAARLPWSGKPPSWENSTTQQCCLCTPPFWRGGSSGWWHPTWWAQAPDSDFLKGRCRLFAHYSTATMLSSARQQDNAMHCTGYKAVVAC